MKTHASKAKARKPAPSLKPKRIDATSWWYEDDSGIQVVVEPFQSVNATIKRISWSALLKAARRCRPLHLLPVQPKDSR